MKHLTLIYSVIFILSVNLVFSQRTKENDFLDINKPKIVLPAQDKIENWLKQYNVPAVGIGIIENNQLTQVNVFGKLETNHPALINTVFNVASLTKPLVAMLTLKLVEAGKLDLDEPLSTYWIDPDIKHDSLHKLLTARIILSHQTGFPNWR